jgi:hypothetical protein
MDRELAMVQVPSQLSQEITDRSTRHPPIKTTSNKLIERLGEGGDNPNRGSNMGITASIGITWGKT